MHVEYGLDLPRELRAVLKPYISRYLDILPSWCHTLHVVLETDKEEDSHTSMAPDYRYRYTKMFVRPEFLSRTDLEREQTIVHEFAHVLGAPLVTYLDSIIEVMEKKEPDAAAVLKALQESGEEAATEDMAQLIWKLTEDRRK